MRNFYLRWASSTFLGLLYLKPFSKAWDSTLNRLLDEHWETAVVGTHTVKLGNAVVWIENAFYSYGTHWGPGVIELRPSLKTMRRLDWLVGQHHAKLEAEKKAAYLNSLGDL